MIPCDTVGRPQATRRVCLAIPYPWGVPVRRLGVRFSAILGHSGDSVLGEKNPRLQTSTSGLIFRPQTQWPRFCVCTAPAHRLSAPVAATLLLLATLLCAAQQHPVQLPPGSKLVIPHARAALFRWSTLRRARPDAQLVNTTVCAQ